MLGSYRHLKKGRFSSILSTSVGQKENHCVSDIASHNQQKPNAKKPVLPLVDDNNDALDTISTPRSSENKENQPITIDDDKFMSDIPQDILLSRHETDNLINRVFSPVLNNCSNINFNVNIYKQ